MGKYNHATHYVYNIMPTRNCAPKRSLRILNDCYEARYLLGISAVCNRLVVIVLQNDVTKLWIWDILYNVPLNREKTTPLILLPKFHVLAEINSPNHLSDTTELTTRINLNRENLLNRCTNQQPAFQHIRT